MGVLPGAAKTGLGILLSAGLFGPMCGREEKPGGSSATTGVGGMTEGSAECEGASLVMFTSASEEELV